MTTAGDWNRPVLGKESAEGRAATLNYSLGLLRRRRSSLLLVQRYAQAALKYHEEGLMDAISRMKAQRANGGKATRLLAMTCLAGLLLLLSYLGPNPASSSAARPASADVEPSGR